MVYGSVHMFCSYRLMKIHVKLFYHKIPTLIIQMDLTYWEPSHGLYILIMAVKFLLLEVAPEHRGSIFLYYECIYFYNIVLT